MVTHWSQDQQDKAEAPVALVNLLQGTVNIWKHCHDEIDHDHDHNDNEDDESDDERNFRRVGKFSLKLYQFEEDISQKGLDDVDLVDDVDDDDDGDDDDEKEGYFAMTKWRRKSEHLWKRKLNILL